MQEPTSKVAVPVKKQPVSVSKSGAAAKKAESSDSSSSDSSDDSDSDEEMVSTVEFSVLFI